LNIDYLNQCNQRQRVAATEGGWPSVAECFLTLLRVLRELRGKFLTSNQNPATSIQFLHIERGAHGVLNKNKNYAKNFISWPSNYLSQKISCGQGVIFARGAHVRAKGRGRVCLTWHGRLAYEK